MLGGAGRPLRLAWGKPHDTLIVCCGCGRVASDKASTLDICLAIYLATVVTYHIWYLPLSPLPYVVVPKRWFVGLL